jgi:hypothetical protein
MNANGRRGIAPLNAALTAQRAVPTRNNVKMHLDGKDRVGESFASIFAGTKGNLCPCLGQQTASS